MVSVATLAEHHGYYRWTLERDAASRFSGLWGQIGQSSLQRRDKETLTNVIWALASLERSFQVLEADAKRAERVANVGAPPVMAFLTGPLGTEALEHLLAAGLWMDLDDTLTAYRALADRLRLLLNGVRAGRVPLTQDEFAGELAALEARRLPELGNRPIREMADNLLHTSWHPVAADVNLSWVWSGEEGQRVVNFTMDGNLRESLFSVVGETVDQVVALVGRVTAS